jgi:ubiquitin carboxyl-terminal hydrolase 7
MAYKVSEALGGWDPLKLRFTSSAGNNNAPKGIIKRALNQTVQEILHSAYQNPVAMLYYEKLDVSIVELETKKSLKVTWTGHLNKDEVCSRASFFASCRRIGLTVLLVASSRSQGQFPFLLPKTNTIDQVGDQLAKQITLSPDGTGRIRFFEISNLGRRKDADFSGSEMIGNVGDHVELYAEVSLAPE